MKVKIWGATLALATLCFAGASMAADLTQRSSRLPPPPPAMADEVYAEPPVVVPVIREDNWSTTYYPDLPWDHLRPVNPTPVGRHWGTYRRYRYGNVVSSRG